MVADILHRQGLVHVFLADIILDQENRGILFLRMIGCLEKSFGLCKQLLMQFPERKGTFQGINQVLLLAGNRQLQLEGSLIQCTEKLVVQIFGLIGQDILILAEIPEKLL